MNLTLIFLTSFLIGFSGAISPGPLLAITVEETIKRNYKAGPLIIIGHSILELLMVIFLIIGIGEFLKKEIVQNYLNIFGGFFLICFGVLTLISIKNINLCFSKISQNNYSLIFKGIFVSISNPYWTIWWVTIGIIYLSFALPYGFLGIFLFFVGHISSDFLWYSFVSYFLHKGKKLIKERYLKFLSGLFGIFLICFGIFLISRVGPHNNYLERPHLEQIFIPLESIIKVDIFPSQ
ncbi:MAG: LysE family translocator [Candidatus Omnitrophica bacterium]|nr:LysE family translocator [Candidatus Omnitrophota bacterium]